MDTLLRDLRYALRMLVRTPAVTAVAVLALALGIGANTAIFSVVYAVLLHPFPVAAPERLVAVNSYNPRFNIPPIETGFVTYLHWAEKARSFDGMAAHWTGTAGLEIGRESLSVPFWRVSASFLPVLGVQPALGRAFTAADDRPGAPPVVLLSDDLWRSRFAADPAIPGKSLMLDGQPYTIVGVMPAGFHIDGKPADIYAPIAMPADSKTRMSVSVCARLKNGVTVEQAQAEMEAVAKHLDDGFGWRAKVWGLRESLVRDFRLSLLVLVGAVALVLLIACANIASLLLARSSARQREVAIRAALGAGRASIARQFLTESGLLALTGGAAGTLLAAWSIRLVPLLDIERMPNLLMRTRIDPAVLAFTIGVALLTGLMAGAAPALSAARANLHDTLNEGGRIGESMHRKRLWNALVVSETALALLLMIGATLLARSFYYLRDTAPGFRVGGLLTAQVTPVRARYGTPEAMASFYGQVLERVRAIPGVQSAALASNLPLGGEYAAMGLPLEGHTYSSPREIPILWHRAVDPEYFRTLGIALRRGRFFTDHDREGATRVVVINETMARRFWPGQDPIGKHLGRPNMGKEYLEIVGVAADVRHQDATKEGLTEVIFPYMQVPSASAYLVVRPDPRVYRNPKALAPAVARAVAAVDATVSLAKVRTMVDIASSRLAPKRLTAAMTASFAALALLLATIGIYGVLSFAVAQRTHEIGVRMALGARRGAVLGMVVRQAAALASAGIAIGIAAALGLTRVIASLLFGVSATDPLVFAGVSAALLAVAATAAYIPARRASRVDPVVALRHE
jgi:putative ABC transport system permease protein